MQLLESRIVIPKLGISFAYDPGCERLRVPCTPAQSAGKYMSRFSTSSLDFHNRLLSATPRNELAGIRLHLEEVALPRAMTLWAADEPIEFVYFPEAGMASMIAPLKGSGGVEVGIVGRDGMAGVSVALGVDVVPTRAEIQLPGHGFRLRTDLFRQEIDRWPGFRALLLRYTQIFYNQVTQTAACSSRHPLSERLARWLLMSQDRAEGDELPLTREHLSFMLGVRRESVNAAVGTLKKAGLIDPRRGAISIVDRPGLEAASCPCYVMVREDARHIRTENEAPRRRIVNSV